MEYSAFPSHRPNERKVQDMAASVASQVYRVSESTQNATSNIFLLDEHGSKTSVITIPIGYARYVLSLLWRRFALALLLHNDADLAIKPYKVWATLAQNLLHVHDIWQQCLDAADHFRRLDAPTIASKLDRYIVTEVLIRRHEPVYISKYRLQRTEDMPNISLASLADIGTSISIHASYAMHSYVMAIRLGSLQDQHLRSQDLVWTIVWQHHSKCAD